MSIQPAIRRAISRAIRPAIGTGESDGDGLPALPSGQAFLIDDDGDYLIDDDGDYLTADE